MRGITFEAFSLGEPRSRRADGAEPRLFAEPGSQPSANPAIADPDRLRETATEEAATTEAATEEQRPATAPRLAAPGSRLVPAVPRLSAGALFHLALVGLVAALTLGAFFGVGFLLLAGPDKKPIAASEPNSTRPSPPALLESGLPAHSTAAVALPSPTLTPQHQAESESSPAASIKPAPASPPPPSIKPAPASPPPPSITPAKPSPPALASIAPSPASPPPEPPPSARPAQAASAPLAAMPPASRAAAASSPMDAATETATPPSPRHAALPHPVGSRRAHIRRAAHTRAEPRHPHVRAHRFVRSPALSPPRVAQPETPSRAGQTQAFDQLLTQLTAPQPTAPQPTAPGEPAGHAAAPPSLTPPAAGQPDPFAEGGGRR